MSPKPQNMKLAHGPASTQTVKSSVSGRQDRKSSTDQRKLRDALIVTHKAACERCGLLAILCDTCRDAVGPCATIDAILRLKLDDE